MTILLTAVFSASLLGSLHCIGMCGPFALLASTGRLSARGQVPPPDSAADAGVGGKPHGPKSPWMATARLSGLYSGGRLVVYVAVGVIFGSLGLAVNEWVGPQGQQLAWWQQTATVAAGFLMVVVGCISLFRWLGWRIAITGWLGRIISERLQRLCQAAWRKTMGWSPNQRAMLLGATTSLMPCGWLYTFALTAAGTGHPLTGGLVMFAFWAGTVPLLTALVLGWQHIGNSLQRHIPWVMACLVIGLGVLTMVRRAPLAAGIGRQVIGESHQEAAERVQQVDHETLPCCQGHAGNGSSRSPEAPGA